MLLDRTLALLKVASYYYIDKIVTAISHKYEADKKLTRKESVAHMQQSFQNFTKWLKQDIKASPSDRYESRVQQDRLTNSVDTNDPLNVRIKSLDQTVGESPNRLNRQLVYTLRKNAKSYTRVDVS